MSNEAAERIYQYFRVLEESGDKELYRKLLGHYNGVRDGSAEYVMPGFVRAVLDMAAYKDFDPEIAFAHLALHAINEYALLFDKQVEESGARSFTRVDKS